MNLMDALIGVVGERAARRVFKVYGADVRRELRISTPESIAAATGLALTVARRIKAAVSLGHQLAGEPLEQGLAFRSSAEVFAHFRHLSDLRVEQFHVILLDGKHRMLRAVHVSQGTLTTSPVHPREVFAHAVREHAAAVVFVHNHPSGDPQPSADDMAITRRLGEVGDLLGIRVLDHVVIGDGRYASFADRGLLP